MNKKITVDKQDWEDIRDQIDLTRCAGDRLIPINSLYVCPHCGAEEPREKCDAPKLNVRKD